MNLDQLTANIRLRSVWEAVDLGFVMVQEWWKSIYLPLAILTFGIAFPLFYLLPVEYYWVGGFIFWWLKPLYDRLVLHIISHKLFNEEITTKQALRALPKLIWNTGFFQTMTFRRFSLSRGFNLSIWQLEQLRGKQRSERQRILHLATHSQAVWLTIGLSTIEFILVFSLFALLLMFLPSHIATEFFDGFFTKNVAYKEWIDFLNAAFYVVVVTFIHPFYIAGNFSLYINRRTQLEAWDIELDFRKMNQRFESIEQNKTPKKITSSIIPSLLIASILIGLSGAVLKPTNAFADEPSEILANERLNADQSRKVIDEVMLTDNLNDKKQVKRWVKKKKDKKKKKVKSDNAFFDFLKLILEPFSKLFAILLESLLWIALAIGLFLLYYFRDRWLHLFQGRQHITEDYQAPEIMFGMDVRPDSLPDDIISEARKLWQKNDHRGALSLLYRGALIQLINQEKVKLEDSHTEGDVLKHAANILSESKQSYLETLTLQWQTIAYAHRVPDSEIMQNLFDSWDIKFASNHDTHTQENKK